MITKLPRWVWAGGGYLAFLAGTVNAVGIMSVHHEALTHLTGTTTLLGVGLALGGAELAHLALLLTAFLLGAILSGALIDGGALRLGKRYGLALMIEAALLALAAPLLALGSEVGLYLAAAACGLQNAMASSYSGAVVRTTHVSGMFTDLGIALGQRLRGEPLDRRRVALCLVIILGFLAGGACGALLYMRWQAWALVAPALLAAAAAVVYTVALDRPTADRP